MVNGHGFEGAVANVTNESAAGTARAALRKNAGLDGADEGTPLLGNGISRDNGQPAVWEGYADLEGLPWYRKPSVVWLLPPFFLFAVAFGGIIVPKLNLILSLVCHEYLVEKSIQDPSFLFTPVILGGDNPQCKIPEVQALATEFTLAMTIVTGILSAIMSPKFGALSDRFGRRWILLISSSGAFFTEVVTIVVATYPAQIHYKWLLVGSVFDGFCGSFTAAMAISYAYATDCTAPPKRAVAFGYFHACLFGGVAIGPLLAAFLFKLTGTLLTTFYVALVTHLLFMIFIGIIIPESLSKKRQTLARQKHAAEADTRARRDPTWLNTFRKANILEPLKILWPTGPGTSSRLRANLVLLSGVDTIVFGVAMGVLTVVVYYTGYQFDWDTGDTSIFVSIVNICRVSGLLIILPLLNYVFRTRPANKQRRESGFALPEPNSGSDSLDLATIRVAVFLELVGYTGYAVFRTSGYFVLSGVIAAFGGIGSPTLQSALTKHVPHDRVGSLLGATGLLHALTRIVCPLIFNLIYAKTVGKFTQAVFVVLAGCFSFALLLSWFIRPHVYLEEPETVTANDGSQINIISNVLVDEEITGM